MVVGTPNQPAGFLPLSSTVFCLDCEVISSSRGDECPACKSHSLLSIARILGGSLRERKVGQGFETGSFDLTLTIEMRQICAQDVNNTLESLTNVIGPRLAQGRASFHIDVQTAVDNSFHRAA